MIRQTRYLYLIRELKKKNIMTPSFLWLFLIIHFIIMLRSYDVLTFLLNLWMVEWFTRRRFRTTNLSFLMPISVFVLVISVYSALTPKIPQQ